MDAQKQNDYNRQEQELKKRYKRIRLRSWLISLLYIALTDTAVWLIFGKLDAVWVGLFIFLNSACAVFLALNQTSHWKKEETKQLKLLMDNAPMGRFNFK